MANESSSLDINVKIGLNLLAVYQITTKPGSENISNIEDPEMQTFEIKDPSMPSVELQIPDMPAVELQNAGMPIVELQYSKIFLDLHLKHSLYLKH